MKNKNKSELMLDSPCGLFYLILSLVVIDCAAVLIACIFVAKMYYLVYAVAGVGILYCLILFVCELIRNKKNKELSDLPSE